MSDISKKEKNNSPVYGEMPDFKPRTDLAVEERESISEEEEVKGVSLREWKNKKQKIRLTEVKILNDEGARTMGKPVGTYMTLESEALSGQDESYHKEVSEELGKQLQKLIKRCCPEKSHPSVLVAGLGNIQVTPDSLGPRVVDNLHITRHLNVEYGLEYCREHGLPILSGIVPGVMGQTGMETAEIIRGIVQETKPDLLIAIDALAARSAKRLATTIQLADTGIHPGSGVGNHRQGLTVESLGIPVIAVGIPTVVGAAAIVYDTVETMIKTLSEKRETKQYGEYMKNICPDEQYELIRELLEPEFGPMFVTPQDIDERVRRLSFTVSEGIHAAFYGEEGQK